MFEEITEHCKQVIIPYWEELMDRRNGGFYGLVDYNLQRDETADKGVILNSRILYFFSRAALVYEERELLEYADWAYHFLVEKCWDEENGGVYWMMTFDGQVKESMKHTYNQAFAIYALSAYYEVTGKKEALRRALALFRLIEKNCVDEYGYLEAFTRDWKLIDNEKLSENGLLADKTMNTLLHLLEAYTLLYHVSEDEAVAERLRFILELFYTKVWNPGEGRLEVFFNCKMESIADLYSYGHDIEASWLLDEAYRVLGESAPGHYTDVIAERIYRRALHGGNVWNECFKGVVDVTKVWWVQAEAVVGFVNAYEKTGNVKYRVAAVEIWEYIQRYFVDKRPGGEWFWDLDENNRPGSKKPITEPWKCPYHNGRMCMELAVRRQGKVRRNNHDI